MKNPPLVPESVIGNWYKDLQSGAVFEVVAWDGAAQTIEIQHIDGEVSELELEAWQALPVVDIEAPEDWRHPFELDSDLFSDPDLPFHPEDWSGPLSQIEPEYMHGVEEF
ncbi:MAG: DUF6763 family protein [Halieaceae bacterium]|jgi:hypothetical protein|nr:DUF6763 family protein [Halieaceae bacterium]